MLLGTLGATLLGSFLTGQEINRAVTNRASEGVVRPGYGSRSSKRDF